MIDPKLAVTLQLSQLQKQVSKKSEQINNLAASSLTQSRDFVQTMKESECLDVNSGGLVVSGTSGRMFTVKERGKKQTP